jgi:ubiquinone/menaquinone biosynthesis C-methylase UbiE
MSEHPTQGSGDFTQQAEAYARARPSYPSEVVDRLIATAGVSADDPVADVGAGTGIFTRLLAARRLRVTAVEPTAAMRAAAQTIPGVSWLDGTFESTGLDSGSQRWVVAAQAFHWADPPRALPEMHRIVVPGGPFTVLWNDRDVAASPILQRTWALIQEMVPGLDEGYRSRDWATVLVQGGWFGELEAFEHSHVLEFTRERFLDLWRSHHVLAESAGPEGVARLLSALAAELPETFPVPYRCRAWTVRAR